MRAGFSGDETSNSGTGSRSRIRSARLRKSRLRSRALEGLEPRVLLAVLPPTSVSNANQVRIDPQFLGGSQNDSTPSIAVDPNNPQYMAAAWTINNPKLAPGPTELVQAAVSTNGGQSWSQVGVGNQKVDPTTLGGTPAPYAQATDATVAFDHSDNLYILYSQHNSGSSTGELLLTKYHASGGGFAQVFNNNPVYQWTASVTAVYSPTLAVDSGVKTFSDQGRTQNDPFAGNVYVSWTGLATPPKAISTSVSTVSDVYLTGSSDGGATFSSPQTVAGGRGLQGSSPSAFAAATPRLAVTQGTIQNGPRAVAPGTVAVVWDAVNQGTGLGVDDSDVLQSNRLSGNVTQVVDSVEGFTPIQPATAGTNNAPNTPSVTTLHFNLNLPANFQTLNNLAVKLGIVDPANNALNIVLVPPSGSGLPSVTLVQTGIDNKGQAIAPAQGIAGANLGVNPAGPDFGTIFDDNALLKITDANAAAPYFGRFRPEAGQLDNPQYTSAPASKLNGQWTIVITNWGTTNGGGTTPAFVQFASLNFTSGLVAGTASTITSTTVRGTLTNTGFPTAATVDPKGIGPDVSAAFDNTLGAYSPYQSRLYATFVDRSFVGQDPFPSNQVDNTDIGLAYSDDAGASWQVVTRKLNDDSGVNDGYSGAGDGRYPNGGYFGAYGRPQYLPSVTVDSANGTVVASWFDARNDPSRARVAVYMTTSIDGGQSYSRDVLASEQHTAVDAITGATVVLGPLPENQSGGNAESVAGYGTRLGLAAYGGKAYPVWVGNLDAATINNNKQPLQVQTAIASYNAGPSVISSTVGPVTGNPAADGTPQVSSFVVVFDRAIPALNFSNANVTIAYHDTTAGDPAVPISPSTVAPQNVDAQGMASAFVVNFPPSSRVGTYTYVISGVKDGIKAVTSGGTSTGNPMPAAWSVPNSAESLPLIVSGPVVAGSDTQNATNNLAVNSKVSYVDVNFDRNMAGPGSPGALTPSKILSVVGPAGSVLQPQAFVSTQIGQKVPDGAGSPLISQVIVPNFNGTFPIANLAVTLNVSSSRVGDLAVYLVGPDKTTIRLALDNGGNGSGFTGTVFSDLASQSITQGAPPFTGFYRPVDPLAAYTGKQLQGPWALVVWDNTKNGSTSTLNSWALVATPAVTVVPNPTPGANPDPAHPRSWRVGFPEQALSGTYTVTIASSVTDSKGNALDTNRNAGVDVLKGTVTSGPVVPVTYTSADVPKPLANGTVAGSTITIPDNYRAQSVTVQLDITHPNDPDLQITLVPPPGAVDAQNHPIQPIVLVARGTGVSTGTQANFSSTVFDEAATTLVDTSLAPFFGRFKPHAALDVLTQNGGVPVGGTWTLQVSDSSSSNSPASGTLNSWSITFGKGTPSSGLGQPVADQATVGFRVFTLDPNTAQAQNNWTPVGPAPVGGPNGAAGPVSAVAVDPSDPSGNTVYVTGASGGVWKTTNFLTTDPAGPTYVPLTDFGPTFAMNIGSISVLGRNNDPRQSIIIAGTGNSNSTYGYGGFTSAGVGFILSADGGASWKLLDSTNNNLAFAQRDHLFAQGNGTSTAKVVLDPHLLPNGQAIIYAAMVGANGGLWRSVDTGQTWQRLSDPSLGGATDVVLDTVSATVDALTNPTGNVNTIYAAFPGHGVYLSPNRGQILNLLSPSLAVVPQIVDTHFVQQPPLINSNVTAPVGAAGGRIVLTKPVPVPGATLSNTLYDGWIYAAVANPNGTLDGVYLTKDFGQTWTKLRLPTLPDFGYTPVFVIPTNDTTQADTDPTASLIFQHSNYNLALTVDPNNPNVVFLGGTQNGQGNTGLIRIDATTVFDTHAVVPYDFNLPDGGQTLYATTGRAVKDADLVVYPYSDSDYINVVFNPGSPFSANSAYKINGLHSLTNSGAGVKWTPLTGALYGATNLHQAVSYVDPLTGQARLIFATDDGVYTGVVAADGSLTTAVGTAQVASGPRNGNLQIGEFYTGAAEPNIDLGNIVSLFLGNTQATGQTATDKNLVTTGNVGSSGNTSGEIDGTQVAVDQQGRGIVYRYTWPLLGNRVNGGAPLSDFFQVSTNGGQTFVSHTSGLIQGNRDAQWPAQGQSYGNGAIEFGYFAVNPIAGDQVIISDATGQIFSTTNQGVSWLQIGQPAAGVYADALAFGAPDPNGPAGIGNLNNFLYAGAVNGHIYVTQSGGGGGNNNAWTDVSNGLDGSPVVKVVPSPARGSHAAYAVTQKGVYFTPDSVASGATWTDITGNLFDLTTPAFGDATAAAPQLSYLTTMLVDWRYAIPNASGAGTHPLLYVAGEGGVFRSTSNGTSWAPFPARADGAAVNGGYLPNVHVTDLSLAVGTIDPTTGLAVSAPGSPDLLLASTFGRGQYAIAAGPSVFTDTVTLDPSQPAPSGSANGTDPATGLPLASSAQPFITGISATTGNGNRVRITLLDMSNPAHPRVIGGYDPSNAATDNQANWTDQGGRFHIPINTGVFTSGGVKKIGVQATDLSGTVGNVAGFSFVISGVVVQPNQPPTAPTLTMNPNDDTSGGSFYTSDPSPHLTGTTDPGVTVQLYKSNGTNPILGSPIGPAVTTDGQGNYSVQFPTSPSGVYVVQAVATNSFGHSQSTPFTFHIQQAGPQSKPTLNVDPLDDTGVVGDGITAARAPHFVGTTDPNAVVSLYRVVNGALQPGVLATATADAAGHYSMQLPYQLFDGVIASPNGATSVEVTVADQAGNPGKFNSDPLSALTIVSVLGDYAGPTSSTATTPATSKTTPALFRRSPDGSGLWLIQGVSPAGGIAYGSATSSIPFGGDFDGDGKSDLAVYQPANGSWYILRSSYGLETLTLGGAGTVPVVGVFAPDGLSDPASYNPTTGQWSILTAASGLQTIQFNNKVFTPQAGDVPVPGNYTGNPNGVDQLAIYRPSNGTFYIKVGTNPDGTDVINYFAVSTGAAGDVPVPGNYNDAIGVRQTDPAVFNPATGLWKVLDLVNNQAQTYQFQPGDIPAPGDYTGGGKTQPVVYRPGASAFVTAAGTVVATLGRAGDIPVTSPLVYRDIVGTLLNPSMVLDAGSDTGTRGDNVTSSRRPFVDGRTTPNTVIDVIALGGGVVGQGTSDGLGDYQIQIFPNTDLPNGTYNFQAIAHGTEAHPAVLGPALRVKLVTTPGDYMGIAQTQLALFRRASSTSAQWYVLGDPAVNGVPLGAGALDVPVTGDFTGSGKASLAVFRPSNGQWLIATAAGGYSSTPLTTLGQAGDIPVPGNFFGSGVSVPAVYRPSDGGFYIQGFNGGKPVVIVPPQPGDIPVVGDFDNIGRDEMAIFRGANPGAGTWYILGPSGVRTVQFGGPGVIPVPGAYDATATNHAVEPAVWFAQTGQYFILGANGKGRVLQFAPGDIPVPGDYEGTGVTEAAVYRPGNPGTLLVWGPNDSAPRVLASFGAAGDVPVLAPYSYRAIPASPSFKPAAISVASSSASLNLGATAQAFGSGGASTSSRPLTPVGTSALGLFAGRSRIPQDNVIPKTPHQG